MKYIIRNAFVILAGVSSLVTPAYSQQAQKVDGGTLMLNIGTIGTADPKGGPDIPHAFRGYIITTKPPVMEKGTFLGVVTTPVPPALREQLKLKNGLGLLVESVEAESPAAAAGIKQYDVLEKFDDQWLINAQQLAVLVRMHASGDKINLAMVRQGQRQNVTAALTEKDLPALDFSVNWGAPVNTTTLGGGTLTIMGNLEDAPKKTDQNFIKRMFVNPPREMRVSTSDDRYRSDYAVKDGKAQLTVKDRNGATVFDGPVDTEEQRKAVPDDLKKFLMNLPAVPAQP